ncbi:MAG: lipoprotein-releasing ABC transporter ATP-binding protein LolD [Arenicella sp.]|jgi:lipoprotein-releasing system ATP-binding protein|nr:lipoprotein-releasing ABC transporter ATP-binding protein LolD [Arenicella sp.]
MNNSKDEPMSNAVLECSQLSMVYTEGPAEVTVLLSVELSVARGERVAIIGASGSGKSTLLHLLAGLELATQGRVSVDGQDLSKLSDKARGLLRNQCMGFVYQFHHLLPEFSAVENVAMPLLIRGESQDTAYAQARKLLSTIGLGERLEHRPVELSGGERQRCAIARALITEPSVVLADEPTGNLDEGTADAVFEMLLELNQRVGTALVMVTHDSRLAARMDKVYRLEAGVLKHD